MFERFTDRARMVIVLAREEAQALKHDYIGTEHLLLGLVHERKGIAAKAVASFGVSLEDLREEVERVVGQGSKAQLGHVPFTPRAKKCLELCLREALQLGHNYIGTEHVLLGLLREGEGAAAQVLAARGVELETLRGRVLGMVHSVAAGEAAAAGGSTSVQPLVTAEALAEEGTYDPKCPNCKRASLIDTAAYKTIDVPEDGGEGRLRMRVVYCEACGIAVTSQILD